LNRAPLAGEFGAAKINKFRCKIPDTHKIEFELNHAYEKH